MRRLIDANALLSDIEKEVLDGDLFEDRETPYIYADGFYEGERNVYVMVEQADTIDPAVHGEWIVKENHGTGWYRITCSECGEDVTSTAPCIGFMPIIKVLWNYCPECGAKMDGERKESE